MASVKKSAPTRRPRAPAPGRITLLDIAGHAGVSRATVSLVMRDSPLVAKGTRERVKQSAAELGYVYNRGAASLRSRRSLIVGVSITDLSNPYFAELTAAAEMGLSRVDRMALLSNNNESVEKQDSFIDTMREYNVDGLIICPAIDTPVASIHRLNALHIPFVFLSRRIGGVKADYVANDNVRGIRMATEHLLSLGHRRIAMICTSTRTSTGRERLRGYMSALRNAGLPIDPDIIFGAAPTRKNGMEGLLKIMTLSNPPTAAVCFNDITAFGVMLGLNRLGMRIGHDFAVVGHDNIAEAGLWLPGLTTIAIPLEEIGRQAAQMLLDRINDPGREPQQVILPPELIVRESSGAR
ncbi:MAG: LacI family DNA-binding transcriptional regulator [Alcaligenaceae bacterium]|nr:LacI family DNA-binding transcriptional regulator [Alcaligenaceae bacterium]